VAAIFVSEFVAVGLGAKIVGQRNEITGIPNRIPPFRGFLKKKQSFAAEKNHFSDSIKKLPIGTGIPLRDALD